MTSLQHSDVSEHREYLSRVSGELGVSNPVEDRFADIVGHWNDLHQAAEMWRRTADHLEHACQRVSGRLGGIDSSWQGADADAFLAHMHEVGLAGNDVVDAMRGFADVLEHTSDGIRAVADDFAGLIADGAESVSGALKLGGEQRARDHLDELDGPARELFESAADVLRAFVEYCDEFDVGRRAAAVDLDHKQNGNAAGSSAPATTTPSSASADGDAHHADEPSDAPAAGAVAGGTAAAGGAMAGGFMPMAMMGGLGRQQGSQQRQNGSRFKTSPDELFGKPEVAAPSVIGEESKKK